MAEGEMTIFTRTFDFLTWLLPATNHFPRAHRHTVTQRLLNAALILPTLRRPLPIFVGKRTDKLIPVIGIRPGRSWHVRRVLTLTVKQW